MRMGDELRRLRLDAGVSLRQLGDATGLDPSHLARIEKGRANGSVEALTAISIALGADLSFRFFADAGPRLHDRHQAPMIEALIRCIHRSWMPRLEVVVPGSARGVADILLRHGRRPVLVVGEAQSQFRRLEQQLRWSSEKANAFRAADPTQEVAKLLLLRSTVATRGIVNQFAATISTAYPARSIEIFDALTNDAPLPGDGILWVRLDGAVAEILSRPPRGVVVGR